MIGIKIQNKDKIKQDYINLWLGNRNHLRKLTESLFKIKSLGFMNFTNYFFALNGNLNLDNIKNLLCIEHKTNFNKLSKDFNLAIESDLNNLQEIDENELKQIFYDLFTYISKKDEFVQIIQKLNVNTCPYCNRQYTMTIVTNEEKVRTNLDYYFPKSKYPYFSISLFNLIPACNYCNSLKGNNLVNGEKNDLLYPYEESFDNRFKFVIEFDNLDFYLNQNDNFKITIKANFKEDEDIAKVYNENLKLKLLYSNHKNLITNLINKFRLLQKDNLALFCKDFESIVKNEEEAKSLILGISKIDNKIEIPFSQLMDDLFDLFEIK